MGSPELFVGQLLLGWLSNRSNLIYNITFETLNEAAEYTFDVQVIGAENSRTWLTILPGLDMRDIKRSFCDQVGVPLSTVKFSLYSYHRRKKVEDLNDEATSEALGLGPDDVLEVGNIRF